jgi:hypothetical protein
VVSRTASVNADRTIIGGGFNRIRCTANSSATAKRRGAQNIRVIPRSTGHKIPLRPNEIVKNSGSATRNAASQILTGTPQLST